MNNQSHTGADILDLADLKEKRKLQRGLDEYQRYLRGLEIGQMESEAQHLLEEFSGQNFGPDYLQRVQLLLGELAQMADGGFQQAIVRLRSDLPPSLT
jgi:hypothetical protein